MARLRQHLGDGAPRRDDRGAATAAVVLGVGLLMVAFVTLANLVVYQYGEGAVRAAAEQAARAGSRASASEAVCELRARETLDAVLGGSLGDATTVDCTEDSDGVVHATVTGTFEGWLETVPDWTVEVSATATKEQAP
jgi:hypothetical protein